MFKVTCYVSLMAVLLALLVFSLMFLASCYDEDQLESEWQDAQGGPVGDGDYDRYMAPILALLVLNLTAFLVWKRKWVSEWIPQSWFR